MDMEISKELLSEVLSKDISECWTAYDQIEYKSPSFIYINSESINIYELAHKCKEWAFKQGYLIGCNCRLGITITNIDTHDNIKWFEASFDDFIKYEIKACQWILDNQK